MFRSIFISVLFVFFCEITAGVAQETHRERILTQVHQKNLSAHPQWRALLHYDYSFPLYRDRSRSQKNTFFISPEGASDPEAEMIATIHALFDDKNGAEIRCRYPARVAWLEEVLDFTSHHPLTQCHRFVEWYEQVRADYVTLVFPASFLNNPASAFGHTFLRLDRREQSDQERLLAYAADYAAATAGEDALTYAIKGIFGGYDGFFAVTPYYKKVTQYSDLENRDIWEYELSLTPPQVARLILHLWEIREQPFSYYYFDENCSYHILSLLHVAAPEYQLIEKLRMWVLPVDTVRVLSDQPGLITRATFRPSAVTKLQHSIRSAEDSVQNAALHAALPTNSVGAVIDTLASDEQKALALDLAYEFHTYTKIKNRDDSAQSKNKAWELLSSRSNLPPVTLPPLQHDIDPYQGHKTSRLRLAAGIDNGERMQEISLRPALHALTDNPRGFIRGSEIIFFEPTGRIKDDELTFQKLTTLQITSLTPRSDFTPSLSWGLELGAERVRRVYDDPLVSHLNVGFGYSYTFSDVLQWYGLLRGTLLLSGALEENYGFGGGPMTGVMHHMSDALTGDLRFALSRYEFGERHTNINMQYTLNYALNNSYAVQLHGVYEEQYDRSGETILISMNYFFTP